ncbi:MAG TPA: HAD family acid phosphatase [Gemmatimonadales bacterium]|nr:HAD family acid phosphatase [Gemmatimonadales bacterium]
MRTHRILRVAAACAMAVAVACSPPAPLQTPSPAPEAGGARTITLAALEASLASLKPSTVVFDIDDTTLYTGLAFLFAQGYLEERDGGRFRDDRRFWTLINDSLDARFSKPKRIARELIAFHQSRGDTIVFVTSRFPSEPATDRTSRLLQRLFAFPAPPTVLFTAQAPKTEAIRSVHPAVSYGDSDGDIADTREADPAIRAVRIIRSPVSYNERPFQPGKYGEEILANSAD